VRRLPATDAVPAVYTAYLQAPAALDDTIRASFPDALSFLAADLAAVFVLEQETFRYIFLPIFFVAALPAEAVDLRRTFLAMI